MEIIKRHIKENSYSPIYLIYGSEAYLKRLYRDKLKNGILEHDDEMNFNYFEGSASNQEAIIEIAETLPFFSNRRLIIVENSGFFKTQNDLADYLQEMSETTHLVFIENEVDKRGRLFKTVKKLGTVSEINEMNEKNLMYWITALVEQSGKKISSGTIHYLLEKSGTDMECLVHEIEKLICFAIERQVIEISDIDAVCTTLITNEIFRMIDAVAEGKQNTALTLYYDLLHLREKPMSVLYLLIRQFNILLQMLDMASSNNSEVAGKIGIPPFTVNKYRAQAKYFSRKTLIQILRDCTDMEESFKMGKINEQLAVELLIVRYSSITVGQ